nr:tetratricopeptide repeat protein [Thioalkalivibrio sp. XN279]
MAFVRQRYYNDAVGAARSFERTLELNPNYVTAYNNYGDVLRDMGNLERMIEVHRKAVELDPLSVFMRTRLASKYIDVIRFDAARELLDEVLAEYPDNDYAKEELANLAVAQGRLADAIPEYRLVHFSRPGDPFSAAMIAIVATRLDDRALAGAWIEAARQQGENNRWELLARRPLVERDGDWAAMAELGRVTPGPEGALLRGTAAARAGDWLEARRLLLEALQLDGYDATQPARLSHMRTLTELAWVEQQLGLEDWEDRAAVVEAVVEELRRQGAGSIDENGVSPDYVMARLAAMRGDRAGTLAGLQAVWDARFLSHWFLATDPVLTPWREDPEFIALAEQVRAHAASERAKLAGLEVLP